MMPGEKVQIDVKEVPYACLRGSVLRDGKHLYQWTAIDECTRLRFMYGYEEHTPENSVDFLRRLEAAFPFEKELSERKIKHKLIPPRTPWHNGKV